MFKIKYTREKAGITQEKLAEKVGISRIYLNELENGRKKNPSFNLLKKIAKALEVKISDLLEEEDESA
ncbi:helix-turn-helix domain-containing protein [Thermosediminibacter litoriperuensis]|uniref:Putative transcriptional regulator n=1 Tax=Thermosediminibacter litoriperuensis TaxID=291989 RepID=A0A5S5AVQ2_9FIRM|nr:helix-turn-helix transcriptional regulator [Thermosediminibacter litoriperuensis]TYP56808.1 putative transcriptional regulator [Thermosediminibacter litoriperuensis]